MCKISVVLTSYNHENFLEQSIQSVLKQTYKDFEFIIVDDCSSDGSWEIIQRYQKENPEIKAIRHDYNWKGGVVEHTVLNYANGDYIAIHHSDDVWEPCKLQKQIEIIENKPECVAVFTNAKAIDDEGNLYNDQEGFYYSLFEVKNRSRYEWLNHFFYQGNCLCHPSILIKKNVYEEDGFFRKGLRQVPDFAKWIWLCMKYDIYVLPEALVSFRVHSGGKNVSGMSAEKQIRSTIEMFLILDEYLGISTKEEFLKIFPNGEKYCRHTYIPEYAFGRICVKENLQPYTQLYGMQLLYHVLNDSEKAEILKKEYNYTPIDFANETGKLDVFGIIPEQFDQVCTIYYDTGDGYNSNNKICKQYTLNDKETFVWNFDIPAVSEGAIMKLRFDPVENFPVKVEIESFCVNDHHVECTPQNAIFKDKGRDFFVSLDPIYQVELDSLPLKLTKAKIEIKGKVERITKNEIAEVVMQSFYQQRDKVYDYWAKIKELEKSFLQSKNECEQLKEKKYDLENKCVKLKEKTYDLENECEQLRVQTYDLEYECRQLKEKTYSLENECEKIQKEKSDLQNELQYIKSKLIYKVVKKFYDIFYRCKQRFGGKRKVA